MAVPIPGKRRTLRWLRLIALIAIAAALLLFQLHVKNRTPPIIRIEDISPIMNFSTVRVRGVLESDARRLRAGSALYRVADGTGTLSVFVQQPPIGTLPKAGARVTVSGSLTVGAGNEIRMRTPSAEQVVLEAFVSGFSLSDISVDQAGIRTTVYGRASKVWKPESGSRAPYKIVLEDASGSLDVVHWLKQPPAVEVDDELEVKGSVDVYKGRVQLRVWRAEDIQLIENI